MIIAIIDTLNQADLCERLARSALPRAACLITSTVRDIWQADEPVPPLSGILVHGDVDALTPEDRESLNQMAQRFPVHFLASAGEDLAAWASRCISFQPQLARKPDRLPWKAPVEVTLKPGEPPRPCRTADVSQDGLYVVDSGEKPSVGDRIVFRFPSFASPLTANAVVRWVQTGDSPTRPSGYGSQFTDTPLWVRGLLVNAARNSAAKTDDGKAPPPNDGVR